MNKLGFVKNGKVMTLPLGFRFHPTDEEIVVEYLTRKVFCVPLPASVITEFDVFKSDPWDFPGDKEEERYFFSPKEAKYLNLNHSKRATDSGYWKTTGKDKEIVSSKSKQVVGMKKTLIFYLGKPSHGTRTDWVMHEYCLVGVEKVLNNVLEKMNLIQLQSFVENWVVCRITLKKKTKTSYEPMHSRKCDAVVTMANTKLMYHEFLFKDSTDLNLGQSSSSSGSSGVTEICYHDRDDHEESSSCNSFSPFRRKA